MLEKQAEDFRKMRSGDMKAFERLFVSLYPGLCNIANHYLNNEMLSKDVAQDAFIKWWNKTGRFQRFCSCEIFFIYYYQKSVPELYPGASERGGSGREVFGRNRCRFRFDGD